jgi:hypothetical protein
MSIRAPLVACFLVAACTGSGNGTSPAADLGAPADLRPPCFDPNGFPDGAVCPASVSGRVVDGAGAPVPDLVVTYCADGCFFGKTGADGRFTVAVDEHVLLGRYALLLHGRPDRASYYWHVPPFAGSRFEAPAPLPLLALPADGPLIALDGSAQTVTTPEGVTLALDAGTGVQLDVEDFAAGDAGRRLRALRVDPPARLAFVDASAPPAALWGFGPFEVVFSKPARVGFPNTTGLAAGTAVDFLGQRGLASMAPPAGDLAPVATGAVSADGQRVEMDAGQGVTTLTWIAIRRRGG